MTLYRLRSDVYPETMKLLIQMTKGVLSNTRGLSLMLGICAMLILQSVVCNWWRKEGGVRWDTRRSGSFIPTRTNTHSHPSPDTESGSLQGLLNSFTPTTPTKKDLWGQTNRATLSYVETCIFLTTWLSWPWNFWEVLPLQMLYFFLMLLYLVTAHITCR